MDVQREKNVTEESLGSSLSNVSTRKSIQINADLSDPGDGSHSNQTNDKMRERITYYILFLLLIIVLYGLLMQNYWLIGIICFPVIAAGAYKIFDRYL